MTARIVLESALAAGRTKILTTGPFFYVLVWMMVPVFNLLIVGLVYSDNRALLDYAIVGSACLALLFGMIFSASELLDVERGRGTLGTLLLTPCSRYAWLGGFQLFAVAEALVCALLTLGVGVIAFGLTLQMNPLTLLVTLVLFGSCMWGFAMVVGAIGIAIRNANQVSNLVFPPIMLMAGTAYPVAALPDWLRVPARLLPFGYGISSLVEAITADATLADVWRDLLPLLGFAVVLPALGVAAFRQVERLSRRAGSLELT
ncbi:MAG TPA: ABC transporter permease [Actinopolymorphaceae bacterium]|jgi:ABC-2 type transport system permease protein